MKEFGSIWTERKLELLDNYFSLYFKALKKLGFKFIYIDAFAGGGKIDLKKGGGEIEGSAVRSLSFPFTKYIFCEADKKNCEALEEAVTKNFPEKSGAVEIINEDCNELFRKLDTFGFNQSNYRGIIFLDPFAMDFDWSGLEAIAKYKIFDIWYLFPFSAINRNLFRNAEKIPQKNKDAVTRVLGTKEWENELYKETRQLTFFGEEIEKETVEALRDYVINRLKTVFPTVSDKAALLRNAKRSPVFLLCFAGSNDSLRAKDLSLRLADNLLTKIGED